MRKNNRHSLNARLLIGIFSACFSVDALGPVYAQGALSLPEPGVMVSLSQPAQPPVLTGIRVYPENPFRFDFILDRGRAGSADPAVSEDIPRLIKYFLAALTVPEDDLWVNLSPYEKDRIVPEALGQTEMGRDLLAQDYLLKQISAAVMYPEGDVGKAFWAEVYATAAERFGTTDIPVEMFNKVWIVPEKAVVYENPEAVTAYVVEARLKVLLEADYLAAVDGGGAAGNDGRSDMARAVFRDVVIPALEREVNEGAHFIRLRQVYHSLILAAWYKEKITASLLSEAYVDRRKVAGVAIDDPDEAGKIWERYVQAFQKGAYKLIKEEYDPASNTLIPRKYFVGGVGFGRNLDRAMITTSDVAMLSPGAGALSVIQVMALPVAGRAGEERIADPVSFHRDISDAQVKPFATVEEARNAVAVVRNPVAFLSHYSGWSVNDIANDLKKEFPSLVNIDVPGRGIGLKAALERLRGLVSSVSPETRARLNGLGPESPLPLAGGDDIIRGFFSLVEREFPGARYDFHYPAEMGGRYFPMEFIEAECDGRQRVILRRHGDVVYYYAHPAVRAIVDGVKGRYPGMMFVTLESLELINIHGVAETPPAATHGALIAMQVVRERMGDLPAVDFGADDGKLGLTFGRAPKVLFVEPDPEKRAALERNLRDNGWARERYQIVEYLGAAIDSNAVNTSEWTDAVVVMNVAVDYGAGFIDEVRRLNPAAVITTGWQLGLLRNDFLDRFGVAEDNAPVYMIVVPEVSNSSSVFEAIVVVREDIRDRYFPETKMPRVTPRDTAMLGQRGDLGPREGGVQQQDTSAATGQTSPGGIDLTPVRRDLQAAHSGEGIVFRIDPVHLQVIEAAAGLTPTIIGVQPVTDLNAFLGVTDPSFVRTAS